MKARYKRILSLLLAMLLVFGLSTTAFAATDTGGSEVTMPVVTEQAEPETTAPGEEMTDPVERMETEPVESTPAAEETEVQETETQETEPETTISENAEPEENTEAPTEAETDTEENAEDTAELPIETVSSGDLPEPITWYDPNDPENLYPLGFPVDNFYPAQLLEPNPYGVMLLAANQGTIPDEMWDNSILRALEYTGFDVQTLKDNGWLYSAQYISGQLKTNAPGILSDIGYWNSGSCPNGDETVADAGTPTGKAPNISYFESNGLVCASFVTYYLCNYLPNVEGVDTSMVYEKAKELGADSRYEDVYYLTTVSLWKNTLDALAKETGSGVTKYTDEDTAYENLVPGDVVVFGNGSSLAHVGIYAGEYDLYSWGYNAGTYHFLIHVGNSRGPEISTVEYMGQAGNKSSYPVAWYHLDFNSEEDPGTGRIVKETNTGLHTSGWQFDLFTDEGCTQKVEGSPFTTGENGYVDVELAPGDYWCKEIASTDPFWKCDTSVKKLTIVSGETASVTFTNTHYGRGQLIKNMPDGGSTEGWSFDVYHKADNDFVGTYTTGADGSVLTAYLMPGEYLIYEQIPDGSLYYCEGDNPQTVTVKAGETVQITFTNRIRPGKIEVQKEDTTGAARSGAEFLLEWSEDGITWTGVTYAETVIKGGCTTVGIADGKLTSSADGKLTFEGLHPKLYYRLTEVAAPEGLQLLTEPAYEGMLLPENDLTVSLRVVNAPVFTLPETGGNAFVYLPVVMLLCCTAYTAVLMGANRRKKV